MTSTAGSPVQLSQAAKTFVPLLWQEFRALFGTELDAVQQLGTGPLRWLATIALVDFQRGLAGCDEGAQSVQRGIISDQIEEAVRSALLSGRLVATGLQPPSMTRVDIAACLWTNLKFAFASNEASSEHYTFTHIEIIAGKGDPDSRTAACLTWLNEQPRQVKKAMEAAAKAQIPGLKCREFSTPYALARLS